MTWESGWADSWAAAMRRADRAARRYDLRYEVHQQADGFWRYAPRGHTGTASYRWLAA